MSILTAVLSSCVWQDMNICDEETHLCFVYDYNLQYIDLFPNEIKDLSVLVFDKEGFLYRVYKDEADTTFPAGYTMKVSLEENEYTFVVWSGLNHDDFITNTFTRSRMYIDDLFVEVICKEEQGKVKRKIPSLWHGKLEKKWDKSTPDTIRLTKNLNTLRIIMKNLDDEGDEIDIHDFDVVLNCANGIYNYGNEPFEEPFDYYPYYKTNHPQTGAIAELNTLRLMAKQKNTLKIIHRETGENILGKDINLNTYFEALRLLQYEDMPLQEYLDRENHYGIIFFYKGFNKDNPSFGGFNVEINGWTIRDQDIEY